MRTKFLSALTLGVFISAGLLATDAAYAASTQQNKTKAKAKAKAKPVATVPAKPRKVSATPSEQWQATRQLAVRRAQRSSSSRVVAIRSTRRTPKPSCPSLPSPS